MRHAARGRLAANGAGRAQAAGARVRGGLPPLTRTRKYAPSRGLAELTRAEPPIGMSAAAWWWAAVPYQIKDSASQCSCPA
jgi:hypothetical protein